VKEWLETISHGAAGAMLTKVVRRNGNSLWQQNEGPRYQRRRSSWGQGEDKDRRLQNGRVDNDIHDFGECPFRNKNLSMSVFFGGGVCDQVTRKGPQLACAHLNTMQRKGSMQCDNTIGAFQQRPVRAVPTFYNPCRFPTV
jgi:hypothetical protein